MCFPNRRSIRFRPPAGRREEFQTSSRILRIAMKFLEAGGNIFRIPDLRKRLLFALAMLAVYRLGGHIPIPGIDSHRFEEYIKSSPRSLFGFFDMFRVEA